MKCFQTSRTFRLTPYLLSLGIFFAIGCGSGSSNNKNKLYAPDDPVAKIAPASPTPLPSNNAETDQPAASNTQQNGQQNSSQSVVNGSNQWQPTGTEKTSTTNTKIDDPAGLLTVDIPEESGRPASVENWSAKQVLEAIDEFDVKVIEVIRLFAKQSEGNGKAVDQLQSWILRLGETKSQPTTSTYGGYTFTTQPATDPDTLPDLPTDDPKYQIGEALIEAFVQNGTNQAFAALQRISTGKTKTGLGTNQVRTLTTSLLLKNLSNPNNSTLKVLKSALEARNQNPSDSEIVAAAERAEDLYLAVLTAAMKAVIGVPDEDEIRSSFGGVSGSGVGYGSTWSSWSNRSQGTADPIQVESIDVTRDEVFSLLPVMWDDNTVQLALSVFEQFPESTDAMLFVGQIPALQTRQTIHEYFQKNITDSPETLIAQKAFEEFLLDPGVHVILKSMPREEKPGTQPSEFAPKRRRGRTREREVDAENQARVGWHEASEQSMFGLLDRMGTIALYGDSKPYHPDEIPLSLHRGSGPSASHRFELPIKSLNNSTQAAHTIVNYIRYDLPDLDDKIVEHYRSELRDEEVRNVLNGRAGWLDVETRSRRDTGSLQTVDIVVSKSGARSLTRQGQGGTGTSKAAIEILVVEVSDFKKPAAPVY